MDIFLSRLFEENYICDLVCGNVQIIERRYRIVFIEYNVRIDFVGVLLGILGYFCGYSLGGNDNGVWDNVEIFEVSIEVILCLNVYVLSEEFKVLIVVFYVL